MKLIKRVVVVVETADGEKRTVLEHDGEVRLRDLKYRELDMFDIALRLHRLSKEAMELQFSMEG